MIMNHNRGNGLKHELHFQLFSNRKNFMIGWQFEKRSFQIFFYLYFIIGQFSCHS